MRIRWTVLAVRPNFCAIKESSGSPDRLHMLARDYPHIQLSCGMDDQALEFFAWGARSWVCAGSNFAPEAHIAMHKACAVEGDFAKGRAHHVGDAAPDAGARAGRKVRPMHQIRHDRARHRLRPTAPARCIP